MRRPATSASGNAPRRSRLASLLSTMWRRPAPAMAHETPARVRFEEIEPRILLSADFMPEAAIAMADGIHQVGVRMDQFLTGDAAFAQRVPLLLKVTVNDDDTLVSEAPTVGDLLTVPVDANGDGQVNGLFFDPSDDDESTLEALDDDHDGRRLGDS